MEQKNIQVYGIATKDHFLIEDIEGRISKKIEYNLIIKSLDYVMGEEVIRTIRGLCPR